MALRALSFILSVSIVAAAGSAYGECPTVLVIPGRGNTPVVIDYFDARWAIVEGDCGLGRPNGAVANVIGGRFVGPPRGFLRRSGYYPVTGAKPARGRHEIEPPAGRELPPAAEDFNREWSTISSAPVAPADLPNSGPMGEGIPSYPPVIVAPQIGPRRRP